MSKWKANNNKFEFEPTMTLIQLGQKDGLYLWIKNNGKIVELVLVENGILKEQPYYGDDWRPIQRPLNFSPNLKRFVDLQGVENYINKLKSLVDKLEEIKNRKKI